MPYSWESQPNQQQQQQQQPQKSFISKVGSFIGSTAKSISQPFVSGVGSAVRSVEATPHVAAAIGDRIIGNQQGVDSNVQQANQIMAKPIFGQDTLQGMNTKEALGTAAKTASFLAPELHAGSVITGAASGGLFGAGESAQHNQKIGKVVASGVVGAVGGAAIGKILDHIFNGSAANQELASAATARQGAATEGTQSMESIINQVKNYRTNLGKEFADGAAGIENTDPHLRLNLSNEQMDALNSLKESKTFSLPKYLTKNEQLELPTSKFGSIKLTPQAQAELEAGQKATQVSLTPTQTQDLITQLDKSTFRQMSDGSLQVDQQRIGLTNELKDAAKEAFGPRWQEIYARYAQGRNAIDSISDFVKIGKNLTASDKNQMLGQILKLSKTPEGQIQLQSAVDAFKNTSGIDLNDPVSSVQKILTSQDALDKATKKAAQPGTIKQIVNPIYLGRAAVRYALVYTAIRELMKTMQNQ